MSKGTGVFMPRCFDSIETRVNQQATSSACDIGPAAHTVDTTCPVQSRSPALYRVDGGARPIVSGGSHARVLTNYLSTICLEDASGLQLTTEPATTTADEAAVHSSTTSSAQLSKLQPCHTAGAPARCSSFSCPRGSMPNAHRPPGRTSTEWRLHRPGSSWREAGPGEQDPAAGTSSAFSRRVSCADAAAAAAQRSSTSTPHRRSLDFQPHNCSTSSGDVVFSGAGGDAAAGADHLFCVSSSSSSLPQIDTSLQLQHSGPLAPWLAPEGHLVDVASISTGSTAGSSSTLPIVMTQGLDAGSEDYTCQQQWSAVDSSGVNSAKLGPLLLELLANHTTHVQHPPAAAGCAMLAPDPGCNLCSTSSLVRMTSSDLAMQLQLSAAGCDCLPACTPSTAAVVMAPCMTASEPLPYLTSRGLTSGGALFPSRALGNVNQPSAAGRRSFDLGGDDIATLAASVAAEKMAQIEQLKALEQQLREQVISLLPLM